MANLLDILPEYVLSWMVAKGKELQVQSGEILYREGETVSSLYLVLDGLFSALSSAAPGAAEEHFGAGSVIGEIPFFIDGIAPSSVQAEEPSLLLELKRATFSEKLLHDHGYAADFYKALLENMSLRLRQANAKLYAGTATIDEGDNQLVNRAQSEITKFKETMVMLDKEGLKHGEVSEDSYQKFFCRAMDLMHVCHELLGDGSSLSLPQKEHIGARLQHEMLPYVLTTETAERFYSKPRGYAGDYLAIQNIYSNKPGGTGRLGPIVDRMFLDAPPSVAVRNRRNMLAAEIVRTVAGKGGGTANVLCMASGPATEVFDAFAGLEDKTRLKVTLLDIDLRALAFVDDVRGKQKLGGQITLVNENLIALFLGRGKAKIEPQDLVYSIGLVDYLNDKLVGKLLSYVYHALVPGGRIILGNFHPKNPAKEFMDYVLEWNLIHRTEADMDRLFVNSPFGRPCTRIQFESQGVDLFAECVKT